MPTLGEELRQARENKGISLRQISDATHIGIRFLQAMEQDNYKILPGGIFNRAFVKNFARYVGVDEEHALAKYQQQLDELGGEPSRSSSRFEVLDEGETSSWSSTLLAALGIIILALGIYGTYKYLSQEKKPEEKKVTEQVTPSATLPVVAVSPTPAESPVPSPSTEASPAASVSPTTSPAVSPSPAPPLSGALTLKLQAKDGDCWVKVKTESDPKGKERILKPGESVEFSANEKLMVSVGNLTTLEATLNGRPARIPSNSKKSKLVAENVTITKDNYQQFLQQ
ncbi:MAG TPA: RodZ domain-containing protein [Blastocatellia bacterium]|nr:RodZ domain-containing protein [Blastocatellia bacterium]